MKWKSKYSSVFPAVVLSLGVKPCITSLSASQEFNEESVQLHGSSWKVYSVQPPEQSQFREFSLLSSQICTQNENEQGKQNQIWRKSLDLNL